MDDREPRERTRAERPAEASGPDLTARCLLSAMASHSVRPVTGAPAATVFPDVARMTVRRQTGVAPVGDAERQVTGVIAPSDLLAKVIGVVSRCGLLQALVRDDAAIRLGGEVGGAAAGVHVQGADQAPRRRRPR